MRGSVLYLHPHITIAGGAGRHTLETARELASRGWRVHIATIRHEPTLTADYSMLTFHSLGGPLPSSLLFWVRLPLLFLRVIRLVDTIRPSILFSQVFPANWWGFVAKIARGASLPHVVMCHEPSAFIHSTRWLRSLPITPTSIMARAFRPLLRHIDISLAQRADFVLTNSRFSRDIARATYDYPAEKVGICYPGVDMSRFKPPSSGTRPEFLLTSCGRLTKFKNIDRCIRALTLIDDPRVTLTIIGDGEERSSLVHLANARGLTERVRFATAIADDELVRLLQSSTALLHMAEDEPFGLAPVEAMACGTPVIAVTGAGPAETVLHTETGYLCSNPSEEDIARAIRWIIERIQLGATFQSACVERASCYTWQQAADVIEERFSALLTEANVR